MTQTRTRRPQMPVGERRAQVVRAAMRVVARDGASGLTTRAVAAEAGIPHGSVHYAFSSKLELMRAVLSADTERAAKIFAADRVFEGTPAEVLSHVMGRYADQLIADPLLELGLQELTVLGARDPQLAHIVAESNRSYRRTVREFLERIASIGGGRWESPAEVVAEHLLAVVFGSSSNWLVDRDDALLRATLEDAATALAGRLLDRA